MSTPRDIDRWRSLHERGDLSAVGQSGLPDRMNRWLYRSLERNVEWFLHAHGVRMPARAFDVGAGTGVWVAHWLQHGVMRVDGCDVVPEVVSRLNERYGTTGAFTVADIGARLPSAPLAYGLVSCMNVLLHLIDDEAFTQGTRHVARLVAPGGWLLLAEPLARDERARGADGASVPRSLREYRSAIEGEGLAFVALAGGSAFGNNPIEGGLTAPFWRLWWAMLRGACRLNAANASWLGPLVYALDAIAIPWGAAPSGKLALFRRPD